MSIFSCKKQKLGFSNGTVLSKTGYFDWNIDGKNLTCGYWDNRVWTSRKIKNNFFSEIWEHQKSISRNQSLFQPNFLLKSWIFDRDLDQRRQICSYGKKCSRKAKQSNFSRILYLLIKILRQRLMQKLFQLTLVSKTWTNLVRIWCKNPNPHIRRNKNCKIGIYQNNQLM